MPQAAPVAADGGGFVVGWSEVDDDGVSRGYVGRLDASGRMAVVGVRTAGTGDSPVIAPFGDRYLAAWVEPNESQSFAMVATAALGRDFSVLASRFLTPANGAAIVRATESHAYIAAGRSLYEIDRDGAPIKQYDETRAIDDVAAAGDQVSYVTHATSVSASLVCPGRPCTIPTGSYSLSFIWLYRLSAGMKLPFKSDSPAAVCPGGSTFLVVWAEHSPEAVKASRFGSSFKPFLLSSRGTQATDPLTQPQVAWDGERWVAVWMTTTTIEAAVITPDLAVMPFTVGRGRRPAIAASRTGRFLVTFENFDLVGRNLASRLIDFTSPGQRERVIR